MVINVEATQFEIYFPASLQENLANTRFLSQTNPRKAICLVLTTVCEVVHLLSFT